MGKVKEKMTKKRQEFKKELIPPIPVTQLNIGLGNICNQECIFCFSSLMKQKRKFANPEFVKKILKEASGLGIYEVGFSISYGEPFLCPEIYDYVKYAKELGFKYVFTITNGTLLNKEMAEKAVDCGFDSIRFSINAGTKETYKKIHGRDEFESVVNNLKYLREYSIKKKSNMLLSVSYVQCRDLNIDELDELSKVLGNYVDEIIPFKVMNPRNSIKGIDDLLYLKEDNKENFTDKGCNMPFNAMYVTYDGYLTPCCVDERNYVSVADLNKVSLKEAWCSQEFQDFRKKHIEKNYEGLLCDVCMYGTNKIEGKYDAYIPEFVSEKGLDVYDRTEDYIRRFVNNI